VAGGTAADLRSGRVLSGHRSGGAVHGRAAVGMLAGTISQVAFELAYRWTARRGWAPAFLAGCAVFGTVTVALSLPRWAALATFALVVVALAASCGLTARRAHGPAAAPARPPRWDIPVRMLAATAVVMLITALTPVLGPHLAGCCPRPSRPSAPYSPASPSTPMVARAPSGSSTACCSACLPPLLFVVLALALPAVGLPYFAMATAGAAAAQAMSTLAIPRDQDPNMP
jgi:hypothetical protein